MNAITPEEREALRAETRRFFEDLTPLSTLRQRIAGAAAFDASVWRRMASDLSLPGLQLPVAYGGEGFGYREASIVAEETGRVLLPCPYLANAFAAAIIMGGCTDEERATFLPGLASGENILAVALVDDGRTTWDASATALVVRRHDGALRLNGAKSFLLAGSDATALLVVARAADGRLIVAAVDPSDEGVSLRRLDSLDLTRPLWRAEFHNAKARRLGGGRDWTDDLNDALARTNILLASEMVGGADVCLAAAVEYTKQREQFGRLIGSFQALKHKAAEIVVEIELARAAVRNAAACLDKSGSDRLSPLALAAAASAKLQANIAYRRASLECLHIHGGIGFTWEHHSHLFVRRAQASLVLFGTSARLQATVAAHLAAAKRAPDLSLLQQSVEVTAENLEVPAFEERVLTWLNAHAKLMTSEEAAPIGVIREVTNEDDVSAFRNWCRKKQAGGMAGLNWPKHHGGQGLSFRHLAVWKRLTPAFDTPEDACIVGAAMAGPIVLRNGNDAQRARYLPKILSGEEIWCQLFSEPGAGSDLAGLRTRARETERGWVVAGQKIWSSVAQFADLGLLLARTDPSAPKHKGLTVFIIDMKAPGVTVKPIRQMNGGGAFNEVFLDGVLIPRDAVIGAVNDGWRIALETLNEERRLLGGREGVNFFRLLDLARRTGEGGMENAQQSGALVSLFVRLEALKALNAQAMSEAGAAGSPDVRLSVAKLVTAAVMNEAARIALELQGTASALTGDDALEDGIWQTAFLSAPARRIAGGSDEIQRSIIAERFLGMPPEARADKGTPSAVAAKS